MKVTQKRLNNRLSISHRTSLYLKSKHQTSFLVSYLDLSFDKSGDVILILKDGESLQQVMFQPLPVLGDLFPGGSCRGVRREGQCTGLTGGARR